MNIAASNSTLSNYKCFPLTDHEVLQLSCISLASWYHSRERLVNVAVHEALYYPKSTKAALPSAKPTHPIHTHSRLHVSQYSSRPPISHSIRPASSSPFNSLSPLPLLSATSHSYLGYHTTSMRMRCRPCQRSKNSTRNRYKVYRNIDSTLYQTRR